MNPIQPGLGLDDIRQFLLTKLVRNKLERIPDKAQYTYPNFHISNGHRGAILGLYPW